MLIGWDSNPHSSSDAINGNTTDNCGSKSLVKFVFHCRHLTHTNTQSFLFHIMLLAVIKIQRLAESWELLLISGESSLQIQPLKWPAGLQQTQVDSELIAL